jgi:hypothetical protein
MSGGVDSSLAAALLVEQGYDVVGVSMRLWEGNAGATESGCCSLDDFLDARRVAEQLGIPFYVMDFRDTFGGAVVDDFVAEYRRGRTPILCALQPVCEIRLVLAAGARLGAALIATGHYARLAHDGAGTARRCAASMPTRIVDSCLQSIRRPRRDFRSAAAQARGARGGGTARARRGSRTARKCASPAVHGSDSSLARPRPSRCVRE